MAAQSYDLKDTVIQSIYLFDKKNRPGLTIKEDGIAIEIKYLSGSLDGLKQAIGKKIFIECATDLWLTFSSSTRNTKRLI